MMRGKRNYFNKQNGQNLSWVIWKKANSCLWLTGVKSTRPLARSLNMLLLYVHKWIESLKEFCLWDYQCIRYQYCNDSSHWLSVQVLKFADLIWPKSFWHLTHLTWAEYKFASLSFRTAIVPVELPDILGTVCSFNPFEEYKKFSQEHTT